MGARFLSRRAQYLDGVPAGVSFPKFLKPSQIEEVKRRKSDKPHESWHNIIDAVILEAQITDPLGQELLAILV